MFKNPALNPAGTHFAAIVTTTTDRLDLLAFELATQKTEQLTGGGQHDIAQYHWLNDRRMLLTLTKDKLYAAGLFAVELGRFSNAYVLQRRNVFVPVGFPRANPTQAIVWMKHNAYNRGKDGGVTKIDTKRKTEVLGYGMTQRIDDDGVQADIVESYDSPKGGDVTGYMADRSGELAFAITAEDGVSTLHRFINKKWERSPVDLEEMPIVGIGDEPDQLLTLGPREEGKPRALHLLNAATGERGPLLFQDKAYDFVGVRIYRHPVDNRILGLQYQRKGPESVWFDAVYERIQAGMERAFPGQVVRIIGSDRAEKQFFVAVSSDVRPTSYFHVTFETKSFVQVSNVAPWIDPERMRPMQLVSYKTRDGKTIEGYVTLPEGASTENKVPLVVLPHGGPWVRDGWGWDPEVQFLASRGYAVFQPNYRGSAGFAWRFPEEDMWAFRKMHDDVTDGVKAVLKTRLIDADRIAIMGASFGGYLALSGAAHEPELYRCAVTIAGVFDWERMLKDARESDYLRGRYGLLKRQLGDPAKRKEAFEDISPIKHVAKVKIPIFVAHGVEDIVTTLDQSTALVSELKKHGVPHVKQIERGEGHGFHMLENRIDLYTGIEAFLAKHLAVRNAGEAPLAAQPAVPPTAHASTPAAGAL